MYLNFNRQPVRNLFIMFIQYGHCTIPIPWIFLLLESAQYHTVLYRTLQYLTVPYRALMFEARQAATYPASAPVNSAAIAFCQANADFTSFHMRTSCLQSAAALSTPSLDQLTPIIQDLLERAHSTRGVLLRDAAHVALLLFPTLILGPQRPSASSSTWNA